MRTHNPMNNPETVEKMRQSKMGRTFLSRGGNGQLTKQQQIIHRATNLPMEYAIITKGQTSSEDSLPYCYKVDLACPEVKLAIEIDGSTHLTKRWKFLDKRKTAVLNSLGWTVLRFTNKRVDEECSKITSEIMYTILKLKTITIISQMES
jgi:hypothetical protein